MYIFFNKHKVLRTILDWTVIFTLSCILFLIIGDIEWTTAWYVPIFMNVFILCLFLYTNFIHEPKSERMCIKELCKNMILVNVVGLVLHTTTGYYKKFSKEIVISPIWTQPLTTQVLTIIIYFIFMFLYWIIFEYLKRINK